MSPISPSKMNIGLPQAAKSKKRCMQRKTGRRNRASCFSSIALEGLPFLMISFLFQQYCLRRTDVRPPAEMQQPIFHNKTVVSSCQRRRLHVQPQLVRNHGDEFRIRRLAA